MKPKYKKRKNTKTVRTMERASQMHRAFNLAINIEDWLRQQAIQGNRVKFTYDITGDVVHVKFEAFNFFDDGTTNAVSVYDGYCMRYNIEPKQAIDNLSRFLNEKPLREKVLSSEIAVLHGKEPIVLHDLDS